MPTAKLTKQYVASIKRPESGVVRHWDTALKGFAIFAQKNALTWYWQYDAKGGRTQRILLGRFPEVNTTRARLAAEELAYKTRRGAAKHLVHDDTTLKEAVSAYLKRDISATHRRVVRHQMEDHLRSWLNWALGDITQQMARRRHGELATAIGVTTANATMRNLRAIWNHARRDHPGLGECPTAAIEWLEERPTRNAPITDLPAWLAEVEVIDNPVHRSAYLFGLYTGMRLSEVLGLEWDRVHDDHIYIPPELNKSRRPFRLPTVARHHEILEPMRGLSDKWCFPASRAKCGHVIQLPPVGHTYHSLRHTFASIGAEIGFLEETVGRLLNHATGRFTARYVKVDVEALRPVMQSIVGEITKRLNAA